MQKSTTHLGLKGLIGFALFAGMVVKSFAHPGDGIEVDSDGTIYFVARSPLHGPEHHACVYKLVSGSSSEPFYTSLHHSSNLFIALGLDGQMYGAERHYLGEKSGSDVFSTFFWNFEKKGGRAQLLLGPKRGRTAFGGPAYLVDESGNIFYASGSTIRKYQSDGNDSVFVGGGEIRLDGSGESAGFGRIFNMAWGSDDSIYVLEIDRVRIVNRAGEVTTLFIGLENVPFDIAVDSNGNVFLPDWRGRRVLKFSDGGKLSTLFTLEEPWAPEGIAIKDDELYILETTSPPSVRIFPRIRKRTVDGTFTTLHDFSE